jgi:PRC-barrel domain
MAQAASSRMTGKPLIESDRVEGTTVYDPRGNNIGSIKRLMIEKISGKVAYAVMSFGGFLGLGEEEHAIPWNKLEYDTSLGGYRTDITEQQLRGRRASIATGTTAGLTGSASGNCTTIGERHTTGVVFETSRWPYVSPGDAHGAH